MGPSEVFTWRVNIERVWQLNRLVVFLPPHHQSGGTGTRVWKHSLSRLSFKRWKRCCWRRPAAELYGAPPCSPLLGRWGRRLGDWRSRGQSGVAPHVQAHLDQACSCPAQVPTWPRHYALSPLQGSVSPLPLPVGLFLPHELSDPNIPVVHRTLKAAVLAFSRSWQRILRKGLVLLGLPRNALPQVHAV